MRPRRGKASLCSPWPRRGKASLLGLWPGGGKASVASGAVPVAARGGFDST